MIAGNNVSKVTVRDLHLTRSTPGAMQGFVTEVRQGEIVLDIPRGIVKPDSKVPKSRPKGLGLTPKLHGPPPHPTTTTDNF